jgi:hypothetical protein
MLFIVNPDTLCSMSIHALGKCLAQFMRWLTLVFAAEIRRDDGVFQHIVGPCRHLDQRIACVPTEVATKGPRVLTGHVNKVYTELMAKARL